MLLKRSNTTANGSSWFNSRSEVNFNVNNPDANTVSPYISNQIFRLPKIGIYHGKKREKTTDEKIYNLIYYDKCAVNKKESEYKLNFTKPERSAYRVKRSEVFVKRNESPFLNEYAKSSTITNW
jgi:hypothetical protein